ncbi:alpha/beta fold hydrolase [Nocardioides daeguensis]|uniref:alpha/beta fold hydrolase n=1 Tax=Nocardioides daeguensis TaxID=908359 RepID=UPI001C43933F|nr:alpha/beta hydrolase [Nocardioides daeguensis]MBV6726941.1 alpha/beta hydrolase [Nocardioides daeguensis]MCR1772940.1 alpha/beta hydrolase [Nocardioides daeguensis]
MNEPVLLLSGSGLPAWIWDEVRAGLDESAVAPRPTSPDAGPEAYAAAALAAVDWPRFTVVAHSVGGVVAQALLAAAPERITGVLGVSAAWPAPGRSFADALRVPQRWLLPLILRLAGTRPPEKQLRAGIGAGLPAQTVDRLVAEFTPESRQLFVTPAPVADGSPARRGYVRTTGDQELPLPVQDRAAAGLGGDFRRDLATGHLPMLEDPAGLLEVVREFLRPAA